jgi:hypothetical protein
MKITVSQLRRLIREVLSEEADVPGRWRASNGEPVDQKDLERLGYGGFASPIDEEDSVVAQGHESSSEVYQMNHQGDGQSYDQMGKRKKS